MADITKTTKTDYKNKGISIVDGKFVDENGEVVELAKELVKVYGEAPFDLTVTKSVKESIDIDDQEEIDADDLSPDEY